jgi:glycerol kinase
VPVRSMRVDGGMVVNDALMQFQADVLGVPVLRPRTLETTALGAAYAAGLAVGYWQGLDDLRANWAVTREWRPSMPVERRDALTARWRKAVEKSFGWT